MTIEVFLRLLRQYLLWLILIPVVTAATAWYVTRGEPQVYKSEATLYTGLASGYSLLTDRQGNVMDHSATAFDNLLTTLNARETLLEVGESLLANHLRLEQPDSLRLGANAFGELQRAIPPDWRLLLPTEGDSTQLRLALDSLVKSPYDNPIKTLLIAPDSPYSVAHIGTKLKAAPRKATNDILLLEYESSDPAMAQQTLRYAIATLNKRYSLFKTSETNSVVGYYEVRLQKAKQALDQAEANLRAFSVNHQVLDYDDEARNVASSREAMLSEYNQELGRQRAAKAALDALNRRMAQKSNVPSASSDLNEKQKKLTQAESQLANARAYGQPKALVGRLQAAVTQASEELKSSAQKYDATVSSSDDLPAQTLASDRLTKSLEYEEATARLELYQKRMDDYQTKTDQYGPLGSQLRQLNRALSVAEKEYLDLLAQVDQSRTRRQDVAIGGTLAVLDAPDFPLLPQPSKRWRLVAIGAGVGLFLALLLTGLRFWLNKRINSPEEAETRIGMPVTALFPVVRKPQVYSRATRAAQSMFEQLFNAVNIEVTQVTTKPYPPIITLFSIRPKQGKTWIANGLLRLYDEADQKVAYCYPRLTGRERRESVRGITYFPYTIRPDLMNVTGIDYLLDHDSGFDSAQYDRIILELPSLINHQIPVYLLNKSALSLLIVDAGVAWARAEKQMLSLYVRVTNQPILLVLNRVEGNYIDVPNRAAANEAPAPPTHSLQSQRNEP